jgi:hypothetical protein
VIGKADGVEAKVLDLTAAAQEFGPGDVGQDEDGKAELVRH